MASTRMKIGHKFLPQRLPQGTTGKDQINGLTRE
jgi:hypothetical protein